jgi:hypothetical protein
MLDLAGHHRHMIAESKLVCSLQKEFGAALSRLDQQGRFRPHNCDDQARKAPAGADVDP